MLLEYRNLYQSCKYTVLDSNYYAIPDFLWFSFPKQSKTMVHLLKIFCRGYINAGKYTSPIERFGYGLGCEIPSLPPKKIITSAFFSGKSLPENLGFGIIPKKIQVPKKISRNGFFPWFFPHPWGTTQFAPPAANEAYSAACLFEGPQGWGDICFSFEPDKKIRKTQKFHMSWTRESLSVAYIHWICLRGKYLLSIWDAPSPSNVGNRDFHPLWLGDSRWSVLFGATSRYFATKSERILCVVKEREGLTEVNDTVFLVMSLSFGCYVDLKHDIQKGCSPGKCRTDTCTKSTEWYIWSVQFDVFSLPRP